MEPNEFLFLILPLGSLTFILVFAVLFLARREEAMQDIELQELRDLFRSGLVDREAFERMRNRLKEERIFGEELEKLQALLRDNTIDQDRYERLRKLLEMAFKERLERLNS
jgi:uncharacterized protein YqgQ